MSTEAMIKFEVGSVSDKGLSPRRPINEDRYLALPEKGFFAVADGVGGELAGEVASQSVVDELAAGINKYDNNSDAIDYLERIVERTNRQIYKAATTNAELMGMASTVALVYLDHDQAIIGHVGDSRVYSLSTGRLQRETHDHTDSEDALRSGHLSALEAQNIGARNVINRAVGAEAEVEAEFRKIDTDNIDAFLLCTDGITRHLPDLELEEILTSNLSPQKMCDELKRRCHTRGAEDNLTAIIVKLSRQDEERTLPPVVEQRPRQKSSRIQVEVKEPVGYRNYGNEPQKRSLFATGSKMLIGALLLAGVFYAGLHLEEYRAPAGRPTAHLEQGEDQNIDYLREGAQSDADFLKALQLFDHREYIAARDRFQALATHGPENGRYHYWLARADFETSDYNGALKEFQKAGSLNFSPPTVYLYQALCYQGLGKEKEAGQSFKRYAEERKKK